jgi:hypothetical protein
MDVAERLGVTVDTLISWEKSRREPPMRYRSAPFWRAAGKPKEAHSAGELNLRAIPERSLTRLYFSRSANYAGLDIAPIIGFGCR